MKNKDKDTKEYCKRCGLEMLTGCGYAICVDCWYKIPLKKAKTKDKPLEKAEEPHAFNPRDKEHLKSFMKCFNKLRQKIDNSQSCCPHGNTTNNCPICEPHTSTGCSCDKCLPQSSDWNTFGKLERKIFEICNRPVMGEKWSVMQSCYDIKNLISSELSIAKKEVEHCGEKNCPECNLKAFNAGKKEERERIIKFIEENLIPIDAKNAEGIAHRYMAEVIRNYIKNLTTNQ